MTLDHLWAGWRLPYLESVTDGPSAARTDEGQSLFEGILSLSDEEGFVVHRGALCSTLLNAYPYAGGHALVLPNRAVAEIDQLTDDELAAFWREVTDALAAVRRAYSCDGVNMGMNLGRAAGAGVLDHVHAHVLPRWQGDTNFMTTVAETRVLPEALGVSWAKIRAAWPGAS